MNKNFYNIDEVSQIVGEQKYTIRFWESRISKLKIIRTHSCLLYTSPSPRDGLLSRMPSSA